MSARQKDLGSNLTLDQFFCACNFGFVRLFFRKFFKCLQRSSFNFFDILQQNGRSKNPKGPPFTFFGTMRHTGDDKNFKNSEFSIFFSRGYCRREYLTY